jgi:hypothetical protein
MQNRTQVTLVITGIGGEAMDGSLKYESVRKRMETVADRAQQMESASFFSADAPTSALPQFEMVGAVDDLDIPAFMRKHAR